MQKVRSISSRGYRPDSQIRNLERGHCKAGRVEQEFSGAQSEKGFEMKKKKIPTVPTKSEHAEQVSIFRLAQLYSRQWPELRFLQGSMNGVRLTIGQAVRAKAAGMKKGVPDIFLPIKRGNYSGLFVELKRVSGGRIEPEQKLWAAMLTSQGYQHHFCKGCDAAWKVITDYLES